MWWVVTKTTLVGGIFPETMTTVHKNIHCPSSSLLSSLSGSFPHWLANILKPAFPCSQWPSRHGPVSDPPPDSSPSSPVMQIDQTTQPPSGSSSDDSTLRTTATMRPTWPNPTFTLGTNEFVIGAASFHSVCTWTLLLLTVVAISGSLWAQWQNYKYSMSSQRTHSYCTVTLLRLWSSVSFISCITWSLKITLLS